MSKAKRNIVLIAMDYDPTALKVAEISFKMAENMKAEVYLLHVISDPVYYSSREYTPILGFEGYLDMSQIQLESREGLISASKLYLEKIKDHLGGKTIHTLVKEGDFAETIIETAKEIKADIIAIGSHSRRWLDSILMGSVTEKVLHHTTIPLFIVPTKKHK